MSSPPQRIANKASAMNRKNTNSISSGISYLGAVAGFSAAGFSCRSSAFAQLKNGARKHITSRRNGLSRSDTTGNRSWKIWWRVSKIERRHVKSMPPPPNDH